MKNVLLLCIVLLAGCTTTLKLQQVEADLLIQQVNIVDVVKGEIVPNQSVAIQGNKITGIYKEPVQPNSGATIINANGQYLIPGLWDMHTHYNWNYTFSNPLLIANGVTGIREMWGEMDSIKMIRQQTANGIMIAPDIYSAGNIIDGTPPIWQGSAGVKNVEEAEKQVDSQIIAGVDFLKVYSLLLNDQVFL